MKKILFPIIALVFGGIAGGSAGFFLRPPPLEDESQDFATSSVPAPAAEHTATSKEFVKFERPFIIPLLSDERVNTTVIIMLALEVTPGMSDIVSVAEPRLRDGFLQSLYVFGNNGNLSRAFSSSSEREHLRKSLLEVAQRLEPGRIAEVLITDFARQDQTQ